MVRSHIIVIAGTTGSGKSTQARLLARELRTRGLKVKLTSLAGGHLLAYLMTAVLAKLLTGRGPSTCTIRMLVHEKGHVLRHLFKLWLALDAISVYAKFLINIHLPRTLDYQVVVEHYLPTTIAEYRYLSEHLGIPTSGLSPWMGLVERLIYKGGHLTVVFLDSDTSDLRDRWRRRGSVAEESDYIYMQRTTLPSLFKIIPNCEFYSINTSRKAGGTVSQVRQNIVDFLDNSPTLKLRENSNLSSGNATTDWD